jgi:hypothetical protein
MVFLILLLSSKISLATALRKTKKSVKGHPEGRRVEDHSFLLDLAFCRE